LAEPTIELEQLEKRLAELRPTPEQTEGEPAGSYDDIFGQPPKNEGKRAPRIQGQNDPRDNVENFRVGDFYYDSAWRDARLSRQLLPRPQYLNPGQPFASFEEEARYEDELNLWMKGKLTLETCIYRTASKNSGSLYYDKGSEDAQHEDMIWMNGVLQGRGLPTIDDDQLLKWAKSPKEYAKMENRRPFQIPEAGGKGKRKRPRHKGRPARGPFAIP
jgi:hypothetical protein